MQPSSLIFLVIIAIWAAYFIQHWVRRREHLATARSVDRFSESMRVLEHRSPLPAADLSAPQPRSYAVSPARSARPEILVKRAAQTPSDAPISASSRAREAAAASSAPAPVLSSGRRTRGLTFLGSLATLLVTVGLVSFGVVPWPAVLAPIAAIAVVMVWMRRGAEAERAARRAAGPRRAARPQPERRDQLAATRRAAERGSVARESASAPTSQVEAEAVDSDEEQPGAARESFYDIQAVERGNAVATSTEAPAAARTAPTPAAALVDEDDIPLTWDPVPVPRPTYTMKAMAHRVPAPPVAQGVPPELAEPAYEEPVRRVAGA